MADLKGFLLRAALIQGAAWGTALAATKRLEIVRESVVNDPDLQDDPTLEGDAGHNDSFLGAEKNGGELEIEMQYGGNADMLLAAAMGACAAGTPSPPDYYQWNMALAEISDFITLALDKQIAIHEFASLAPVKFILSAEAGGRLIFKPTLRGRGFDKASTINTTTTMGNAGKSAAPRILFSHFRFFLGDNADALDVAPPSSDEITLRGFELSVDPQMDNQIVNTGPAQPTQENRRVITLTLKLPKLSSINWKSWQVGMTHLQFAARADATIATKVYKFYIHLGKLEVRNDPTAIGGPELVKPDLVLVARRAATLSLTWTGMTEELEIQTQNQLDANPLA